MVKYYRNAKCDARKILNKRHDESAATAGHHARDEGCEKSGWKFCRCPARAAG
jgi:hypothetical protein